MDDFVIFDTSRERLHTMRTAMNHPLWALRLDLHPGKSRICRVADGVTFLGFRIFPDHARLVRPNVARFRRRMRAMQAAFASGAMDRAALSQRIQAWIAHAAHGDTWRLRERVLNDFSFTGGRRTV